jgi:hypothetical protein
MTTTRTCILAVTAIAATATGAGATSPTRVRIDAGIGALAAGSDASFSEDGERYTAETDGGPALRVGAGYRLTDRFDLNASAQAASASTHLFERTAGYTSITGGTRFYPLGRDLRVRPLLIGEAGCTAPAAASTWASSEPTRSGRKTAAA